MISRRLHDCIGRWRSRSPRASRLGSRRQRRRLAVAAAEMCIASGLGMRVDCATVGFEEKVGHYLVEVESLDGLSNLLAGAANVALFGSVESAAVFIAKGCEIGVDAMAKSWRGTLDW